MRRRTGEACGGLIESPDAAEAPGETGRGEAALLGGHVTGRGSATMLLALLVLGFGALFWWRCEGEAPTVVGPERLVVGKSGAAAALEVSDQRSGLRSLRVVLRHAKGEETLYDRAQYPGHLLAGGTQRPSRDIFDVRVDPQALGLEDGEARLEVEAVDWSWASLLAGNTTLVSIPVEVDLTPPRLWVESGLTYVRRGGSAAVVYSLEQAAARDGVQVGEAFFPGFPFPTPGGGAREAASAGRRFALFAVPRNAPEGVPIEVMAEDAAGNQSRVGWPTRLRERRFEEVRLNLPRTFLSGKVPRLASAVGVDASDPVAAFQQINTEVRAANEARIREVVVGSSPERRWRGAFTQLRNSAVTSRFAEHRRYFVDKEPVSEAIHYGYDLASTAGAPITASNAGSVLFADDLGIYGNCVIVDHGLGLTTLYAHLSRVDVAAGDAVQQGQILGLSGATGLAGGDHLHFAVMVSGTYVDPKEWWDPRWVREHVEARLAPPAP